MRLLKYLNEKFFDYFDKKTPVFINPTMKEMKEADVGEGIRFIADRRDKKLYVWNAFNSIHWGVWKKVIKKGNWDNIHSSKNLVIFLGYAEKKGNKYVVSNFDIDRYVGKGNKWIKQFDWVNKYINIKGIIVK